MACPSSFFLLTATLYLRYQYHLVEQRSHDVKNGLHRLLEHPLVYLPRDSIVSARGNRNIYDSSDFEAEDLYLLASDPGIYQSGHRHDLQEFLGLKVLLLHQV